MSAMGVREFGCVLDRGEEKVVDLVRKTSARMMHRRALLAGVAVSTLGAVAPVSAWAQAEATPTGGEWSFTDDAGTTIAREKMPQRVVAYLPLAAALWDFGIRPVGVYGTTHKPDGTPEVYAGNVDFESVTSIGPEYGSLDIEALVALQPDLLVNDMWADPPDVWGLEPDIIAQVEGIAPIAQIKFVDRPISDTIASVEALAGALGADLDTEDVTAARADFEVAAEDVRAAVAENPGLKVLFASGTVEESFWIANPSVNADLLFFKELGVDVVQPENPDGYWEELSWEQAAKYDADLILLDARQYSATGAELKAAIPTFASLSAAKADQFGPWATEYVPSYAGFTPVLLALAEAIRGAERVIGS